MDTFNRIKEKFGENSCWYVFLLTALIGFLGLIAGANVYFLIDRRDQIWPKTFYRLGLMTVQQFFFMWRVWDIRILQGSPMDVLTWILFTYFPVAVSDNLLESFLFLKWGKDTSSTSRTKTTRFPGTQQTMISSYFQLYIYSLVLVFFAAIGMVVYWIIKSCRRGRNRERMSVEKQREVIQARLEVNKLMYQVEELREKQCSICQGQMREGQGIIKLRCRHIFHKECVFQWFFRTNKEFGFLKCPNCRKELTEEVDE